MARLVEVGVRSTRFLILSDSSSTPPFSRCRIGIRRRQTHFLHAYGSLLRERAVAIAEETGQSGSRGRAKVWQSSRRGLRQG